MSYLRHCYIPMCVYVSSKMIMNTQEKRVDISPFIYVIIMITVFTFSIL